MVNGRSRSTTPRQLDLLINSGITTAKTNREETQGGCIRLAHCCHTLVSAQVDHFYSQYGRDEDMPPGRIELQGK